MINTTLPQFKPAQQKQMDQAVSGMVYVNTPTYKLLQQKNPNSETINLKLNGYVVKVGVSNDFQDMEIALNKFQRQIFKIDMVQPINAQIFLPPTDQEYRLSKIQLEIDCIQLNPEFQNQKFEVDDSIFHENFISTYKGQFLKFGQILLIWYNKSLFTLKILNTENIQLGVKEIQTLPFGMVNQEMEIELSCKFNKFFSLKKANKKAQNIFVSDFKFENMGIGGLDEQLANIFRRAFASRRFPPSVLKKYGISHVKGVLLYGPPGTGKTLIARKLSKALNSVEPKIVNGPEIMSAYVGKSEENIRNLFKDAIQDQQNLGEESQLHIIIFDEMDAICKQRGREAGAGGSAKDGVVNQLLSMIDGVEALNNVMVIGMTNRKDLLDEAILRPGRFEVHVEISLPDEKGRQDILQIHTKQMTESKVLHNNVSLEKLANSTKNFTGAEIESLVKSAASFAFNRVHNIMDFNKQTLDDEVIVEMKDFETALQEIKPSFGFDQDKFDVFLRNDITKYGKKFLKIEQLISNSIAQTKTGRSSQLHTVLLEGKVGTGKTAIAAWAAVNCDFPFVQMISPENFVGFSESGKINAIVKVFEDAYKSPLSCILLDNIERLIEFIDLGPRFSNGLLQTLLVLIKKIPKNPDNRLLIIGTTNQANILKSLEITQCFNLMVNVPILSFKTDLIPFLKKYNIQESEQQKIIQEDREIPVKQLLMMLDMLQVESEESGQPITCEQFMTMYDNIEYDQY